MFQIKKLISSIIITGLLCYVLFAAKDWLTRIIVLPFLTFALAYFLRCVFLLAKKKRLAAAMSKVYAAAFAVYWFGFLIVWDYISLINRDYVALLISLVPWIGGGWILYRRFKR